MKKIIVSLVFGAMVIGCTSPIYAAENEIAVTVEQDAPALAITPKLNIPHIVIPKITPKFDFKIDFSKYFPKF